MKKILFVFAIVLSITNLYCRDFIIAGIPEEPNRWVNEQGETVGIDVEIAEYIFDEMGINYKIELVDASSRLEKGWKTDKPLYDMVFTYSIKSSRQEYLTYANESHITFSWNFFILKKNEGKVKYNTFDDFKGNIIGMTRGFSYTDDFMNAVKDGVFQVDESAKNSVQLKKLLAGRFDAVPLNTVATLYELKIKGLEDKYTYLPKPLKEKPYYNTFPKHSTYPGLDNIIKQYDEILARMKKDGTLKKILAKYGINQ